VFAEFMGRYLVKVSVVGLASSGLSCVLIRRQLGSLFRFSPLIVSKGVELRSDRANLFLEFGVLVLEVLLLRFDLCRVSSDVLDDVTLLCYDLY
jgi:hypothetical protein